MTTDTDRLKAVLQAALDLLGARDSDMETVDEWDALEHACAEASEPPADECIERFGLDGEDLVRWFDVGDEQRMRVCCSFIDYECIAAWLAASVHGFLLADLAADVDATWPQVGVAIRFLMSRGLVERGHGRAYRAVAAFSAEAALAALHDLAPAPPPEGA